HLARGHHLAERFHLRTLDLDKTVVRHQSIRRDSDIVVPGMHDESDLLHGTAARLAVPASRVALVIYPPLHGGIDVSAIAASPRPALVDQLVDQVPITIRVRRGHCAREPGAGDA